MTTKYDRILIIFLLVFAIILYCFTLGFAFDVSDTVRVSLDGKEYGRYSLLTDEDITISTEYGNCILSIKNGEAEVVSSECPDKYCENMGRISGGSQVIVCVPLHLVIDVVGQSSVDKVAY